MKSLPRSVLAKLPPGTGVNPAAIAGGAAVDLAALLGPDPLEAEFQAADIAELERTLKSGRERAAQRERVRAAG